MATEKKKRRKRAPNFISPNALLKELPGARLVTYDPGTFLFHEGDKASNCCLIKQGRVRILKRSAKGEDLPLATAKPGEFLGEMAMLSRQRRSATAQAVTRVKTIVVEYTDFVALLKEQNPLAMKLSLQLSTLLAARCHRLLNLVARQEEIFPHNVFRVTPHQIHSLLGQWAV
jgi:CRP-like cAMP-binding protein